MPCGTDLLEVRAVRRAVPDRPLWVGSGVTASTVADTLEEASGVIVGTALKESGEIDRPVGKARVEELVRRAAG